VGDHDGDGVPDRMVKFSRQAAIDLLPVGDEVEVVASGELVDGTEFAGSDTIRVVCRRPPIAELPFGVPDLPALRVRPGPTRSSATVEYQIGVWGAATLRVYDVSGRLVRTLVDGRQAKGGHSVVWDGRSNDGREVSSGVYFVRLETEGVGSVAKTLVLR